MLSRIRSVLIVVSALVMIGEAAEADIPGVVYNSSTGHWYKLYVTNYAGVTWTTCQSRASAVGGYLACVTSAAENQWITGNGLSTGSAFIGGSDAAVEGTWRWVSGETWSYANWAPGEPKSASASDYARMETNGQWVARTGGGQMAYGYIVEWNKDPNAPPPPPPPPPGKSDLNVLSVSVTPGAPRPGEAIETSFTCRNDGTIPTGTILGRLYLTGSGGDPLSERTFPSLGQSASRTDRILCGMPLELPPGEYHLAILLSDESGKDANLTNNTGRYAHAIRVDADPIPLVPQLKISGILGPVGCQLFTLDAFPALTAKLKVKLKKGYGSLRLERDEDASIVAESLDDKRLKTSISAEDGPLHLRVESESTWAISYKVTFKVKSIREEGELSVGPEPVDLEIPGFPGMKAKLKVKGIDGLVPVLDVSTLGDDGATVKHKGTKAKAKGLLLGEGPWIVRVSSDSVGRCTFVVKVG